jgi:hypothetical protein
MLPIAETTTPKATQAAPPPPAHSSQRCCPNLRGRIMQETDMTESRACESWSRLPTLTKGPAILFIQRDRYRIPFGTMTSRRRREETLDLKSRPHGG